VKEIIKFKCYFYHEIFDKNITCFHHENSECLNNPSSKACQTCKNLKHTSFSDLDDYDRFFV